MIADIIRVWPGSVWTRVVVRDHADGVTKVCRIWMVEDIGRWMASLCHSAKGPIVLTVDPPRDGEFEIIEAEKFPTEVKAS